MGKITIAGKASRRVTADMMCIRIKIRAAEKTTARALMEMKEQSESLLGLLEQAGLNVSDINLVSETVVEERDYSTKEINIKAEKELEMHMSASIAVMNMVMDVIQKSNYDIITNVDYYYNNLTDLQTELMNEAVLDSKCKVMAIADVLGETVTGVDEIVDPASHYRRINQSWKNLAKSITLEDDNNVLANRIGLPEFLEKAEVEVTWNIEQKTEEPEEQDKQYGCEGELPYEGKVDASEARWNIIKEHLKYME